MKIRAVQSGEDIAGLLSLAHEMHAESNFRDMDFSAPVLANKIAVLASTEEGLALLAEDDHGEIYGGILASVQQSDFGCDLITADRGLYVRPSRRGTLAAKHLVKNYIAWAQVTGAKRICFQVNTGIHVDKTTRFLERQGFKNIGTSLIYQE